MIAVLILLFAKCVYLESIEILSIHQAIVNVSYLNALGEAKFENSNGWFSSESRIDNVNGRLIHATSDDNKNDGCSPLTNIVHEPWVALIERGVCKFHQKIYNAAVLNNASAVIIYNNEETDSVVAMKHKIENIVAIFVNQKFGLLLFTLLLNSTKIYIDIINLKGQEISPNVNISFVSRTSVLFVSISFIILIVVSLCWLAIYYVQRFRYLSNKHVSKRLMNAAWKAVQSMEQKSIKSGDAELLGDTNMCAICVENYQVSETIRILPCKHTFHKSCVDAWLLEQRRCPMCQSDILHSNQTCKKKKITSSASSQSHLSREPVDQSDWPLVSSFSQSNGVDPLFQPITEDLDEQTETEQSDWVENLNTNEEAEQSDWTENVEDFKHDCDDKTPQSYWPNDTIKKQTQPFDWSKNSKITMEPSDWCKNMHINDKNKIIKSHWLNGTGPNKIIKMESSDWSPKSISSFNSKRKISDVSTNLDSDY